MFENIKRCGTRCTICTVNFFLYIRTFSFICNHTSNFSSLSNKLFLSVLKISTGIKVRLYLNSCDTIKYQFFL